MLFIVEAADSASTDADIYAGRVLEAAWVKDGIDENEILLFRQARYIDDMGTVLRTMAEPSFLVIVEERVITLPLSGEVPLFIIRTEEAETTRSMDGLEYAVRGTEELLEVPLPVGAVRLLLDPFMGPIGNARDHIILPARTDGTDWLDGAIIHEVAHYYGAPGQPWAREGVASIVEDIVAEPRSGRPVDANNYPCAHAEGIDDLERDPHFLCNYSSGKRIFVDMYRILGAELFRVGLRNLISEEFNVDGFRRAFARAAPEQAEAVDAVVNRWYNGPQPRGVPFPDTGPVSPTLEGLRGRVSGAHIVLHDHTRTTRLDAKAAQGVWLRLDFAFQYTGVPREVTLRVVGHFEDGFTFRYNVRTFSVLADDTAHTEWAWLGIPTSVDALVPGQYRVDVFHEDNKVAEASFEIDLG